MFDELNKYKRTGHFIFRSTDNLAAVCNAPKGCSGLYIVYALKNGSIQLIYIGISGRKGSDGKIKHRLDGLRGRFLTGKQFGELRKISWPKQMKVEKIEALDIYWYVTYDEAYNDFPNELEDKLLEKHKSIYGSYQDGIKDDCESRPRKSTATVTGLFKRVFGGEEKAYEEMIL